MKWFQIDSDTPNDPKIRSVLAKFGNEGFAMLIRLWCYIAAHGTRKPGWSLDSLGKPIDKAVLVEAAGTTEKQFDDLLRECTRNGHVRKNQYVKRGVIVFPAMSRRADTYSRRRVRTLFEQTSNKLRTTSDTRQDKTSNKTPLPPFGKGGRVTRAELQMAKAQRERVHGGCPHEPHCPNYLACVELLARTAKVAES